jgi:hypothetical protein
MTNCTAAQLEFPALKRRKIEAQFSGGAINSDGGVLLLRAIDQQLKLTKRVAAQMPDPRDPDRVHHQIVNLLRQRVYGLACGYEDLNDHDTLRTDIAFLQTAVEKDQVLGSRSTLGRFEQQADRTLMGRVHEELLNQFTPPIRRHLSLCCWILTPPMIRCMGSRKIDFFIATTGTTVFCRCMFFVATSVW